MLCSALSLRLINGNAVTVSPMLCVMYACTYTTQYRTNSVDAINPFTVNSSAQVRYTLVFRAHSRAFSSPASAPLTAVTVSRAHDRHKGFNASTRPATVPCTMRIRTMGYNLHSLCNVIHSSDEYRVRYTGAEVVAPFPPSKVSLEICFFFTSKCSDFYFSNKS